MLEREGAWCFELASDTAVPALPAACQVGMSGVCYPDSLIGTIPNLYYYAANNPSEVRQRSAEQSARAADASACRRSLQPAAFDLSLGTSNKHCPAWPLSTECRPPLPSAARTPTPSPTSPRPPRTLACTRGTRPRLPCLHHLDLPNHPCRSLRGSPKHAQMQ